MGTRSSANRRIPLLLLCALLPTLTFFGHWPSVALPIPGTRYVLSIPFASETPAAGDHHQHCHSESAQCSSGPGSLALGISLLAAAIAVALPGGVLRPMAADCRRLVLQNTPSPEPSPPRTVALSPAFI